MKQKLLNYFTKHYNLISKDRIKDALDLARKNERNSIVKKYEERMANDRERLENEHLFAMQEKEAEAHRLSKEIEDLKISLKRNEIVYFKSVQRAKTNFRIANDMKYFAKKYMDTAITSFQSVQNVFESAEDHHKQIENEEQADKELLGIK